MAKIKVYELAQELDMQSKDLLSVLKDKGIEVKNHMSVLEDDQVSVARGAVKKSSNVEAPAKAEAPAKTDEAKADADHVKKKKSIIFVSNPQNSKIGELKWLISRNMRVLFPLSMPATTKRAAFPLRASRP